MISREELGNLIDAGKNTKECCDILKISIRKLKELRKEYGFNRVYLKFKTNASKSIFPSKMEMYKKAASSLTEEDIVKIHNILTQNEIKFKKGEISDEMFVLHSMNFILNYSKIE